MKKLILSLSLFLSFSSLVHAQWTTDPTTNNMNNTNTGNVGVGTSNGLNAKFTIYQAIALGTAAKNNILLSATSGATPNNFRNSVWLVRNTAGNDWLSARLHDGISIDGSYLTPQTDTKTWWERDPYNNVQSWGSAAATYLTINAGNIGIGTTTPTEKLVVNGNIKSILESTYNPAKNVATIKQLGLSGSTGAMNWTLRGVYQYPNGVSSNADGGDLDIIKSLDGNTILGTKTDGTGLGNVGIGTTTPATQLHLATAAGPVLTLDKTGVQAWRLDVSQNSDFRLWNASVGTAPLTIQASGNVGIGTTTPKEALSVNGNIRAKQVKVESANWPDYVFQKDYQLPSLQEVKKYIDQNQHLPEIPSEQQIAKEGLNLGEMNKLLMKKVEELTLYLIEQKEENAKVKESQEKLLKTQQAQIDLLIKTVASLQKSNNNK